MDIHFEDAAMALHTLKVIKQARLSGNAGFTGALDEYMDVLFDALCSAAEFCRIHGDDYGEYEKWYFSSSEMVEFYRLCRRHASLTGKKLKDDPYMKKSLQKAQDILTGFWGHLHTGVRHQWDSGILLYFDLAADAFSEMEEAIERLPKVFGYYRCQLPILRTEIEKLQREREIQKMRMGVAA